MLVKPVRQNDDFSIARLNNFFFSNAVSLLSFRAGAISIYARLRAYQGVKPLDALHLACAAHAGVDLFITNDQHLTGLRVPGIAKVAGLDTLF